MTGDERGSGTFQMRNAGLIPPSSWPSPQEKEALRAATGGGSEPPKCGTRNAEWGKTGACGGQSRVWEAVGRMGKSSLISAYSRLFSRIFA